MIYQLGDLNPQIYEHYFIAKSADIIGNVVESKAYQFGSMLCYGVISHYLYRQK